MIKELKELLKPLEINGDLQMHISPFKYNGLSYNVLIRHNVFDWGLKRVDKGVYQVIALDTLTEEEQSNLMHHINTPTIQNCLLQLEKAGWSMLIDSRWEDDVKTLLKESFPEISNELIQEVLDLVLV